MWSFSSDFNNLKNLKTWRKECLCNSLLVHHTYPPSSTIILVIEAEISITNPCSLCVGFESIWKWKDMAKKSMCAGEGEDTTTNYGRDWRGREYIPICKVFQDGMQHQMPKTVAKTKLTSRKSKNELTQYQWQIYYLKATRIATMEKAKGIQIL